MCNESQLQTVLKAVYQKSAETFGEKLDAVILFGSYARGDYDEESDIDIMVRVKLDKEALAKHQWDISVFSSRLGLEHGVVISIHLQDYDSFATYQQDMPFFQNVIKDGVQIVA